MSPRNLLPFPEEFPGERRTEEVMWIQLANVKPGQRARFLELRRKLLAKLANREGANSIEVLPEIEIEKKRETCSQPQTLSKRKTPRFR